MASAARHTEAMSQAVGSGVEHGVRRGEGDDQGPGADGEAGESDDGGGGVEGGMHDGMARERVG